MSSTIDLDALIPPSVTVKFGGAEIEIKPPTTGDVLRLGFLGQKLQDANTLTDVEIDKLVAELTGQVAKCVPELAGKDLSTAQLLKLVEIIGEMSVPPDAVELKKRGISTTSPKAQ